MGQKLDFVERDETLYEIWGRSTGTDRKSPCAFIDVKYSDSNFVKRL